MVFDAVSFTLFIRRCVGLIFTPYATMRKISLETKWSDLVWIYTLGLAYFVITYAVRFAMNGFVSAIILISFSIGLLSLLPAANTYSERLKKMVTTWSYTLLPTLIWFYSTLIFYFLVPPPRTPSFLGKSFSIFYIAFSSSLFVWKLILIYLSVRFSLKVQLYRIIYYLLIYFALSIPLWILFYKIGLSRIPFV